MFQKPTLPCYFLLIIAISSFTTTQARFTLDDIRTFAEKCAPKPEDLATVLTYTVPETESGKCLINCMLKQFTTIDADGKYSVESAKKVMNNYWKEFKEEDVTKLVEACGKIAEQHKDKENTCEYGYHVAKCFQSKMKQMRQDIYTYVLGNATSNVLELPKALGNATSNILDKATKVASSFL